MPAFKKDLTNTLRLCEALGNPQNTFRSIHIGGTNGKGSAAHMSSWLLREAGYNVGLYTSPHLKTFRERIQVNGRYVDESFVCSFVSDHRSIIEEINPSFFEITVAMAFEYFGQQQVDVAVIEVGLGGRLDSTNVVDPEISLITNIALDHTDMLGDSRELIAFEKAGIIKQRKPVVIGESHPETDPVFDRKAREMESELVYADKTVMMDITGNTLLLQGFNTQASIAMQEAPAYRYHNIRTVFALFHQLLHRFEQLRSISFGDSLAAYLQHPTLEGRWQTLGHAPLVICDTAHNEAGVQMVMQHLQSLSFGRLFIVWGMVREKNADVLQYLPEGAHVIACQPQVPRAKPARELQKDLESLGFACEVIENVNEAVSQAKKLAGKDDMIFIGGSTFVVAELNEIGTE